MKYKKIVSLFMISIALTFGCIIHIFAESSIIQNVDLRSVPMQADLMKFEMMPTSIALNENGFAAVSYDQGNRRFVILFCPDGTIKQYSFQSSGSYVLDMDENRLIIYLVRSDVEISLNLYSEDVSARKCDTYQVDQLYVSLKGIKRIDAGNNVLSAIVEHGHYSLYLNGNLILQTTTTALIVHYLGFCLPFAMIIIGIFVFYRRARAEVVGRGTMGIRQGDGPETK